MTPLIPDPNKLQADACAIAALNGIEAVAARNDFGRRTIILRRGTWCVEIEPHQLAAALAEARALAPEVEAVA